MLRRLLRKFAPSVDESADDGEFMTRHLNCPQCRRILIIPRSERFRCQCSMVFRVTGENKIQLCGAFRNGENELDEDKCGLPRGLVERMPTITVDEKMCASRNASEDEDASNERMCRICLSDYKVGDVLRVLPCFHKFHASEIDDWLERNGCCPLCHLDVSEALTGSSGKAFLTVIEGDPRSYHERRRR